MNYWVVSENQIGVVLGESKGGLCSLSGIILIRSLKYQFRDHSEHQTFVLNVSSGLTGLFWTSFP